MPELLEQTLKRMARVPDARDDIQIDEHSDLEVRCLLRVNVDVQVLLDGFEHAPRQHPFVIDLIFENAVQDRRDLRTNTLRMDLKLLDRCRILGAVSQLCFQPLKVQRPVGGQSASQLLGGPVILESQLAEKFLIEVDKPILEVDALTLFERPQNGQIKQVAVTILGREVEFDKVIRK